MRNKSYSKRIEDAQVMLSGITEYKDSLADRGINDEYIDKFKTLTDLCVKLNNDQERTKGSLKDLTKQIVDNMNHLDQEVQFCKRGVMINMPKTLWKSFGFIWRPKGPNSQTEPDNPPDEPPDDPPDNTLNAAPDNDNAIGYVTTAKSANVLSTKSMKNRKRRKRRR